MGRSIDRMLQARGQRHRKACGRRRWARCCSLYGSWYRRRFTDSSTPSWPPQEANGRLRWPLRAPRQSETMARAWNQGSSHISPRDLTLQSTAHYSIYKLRDYIYFNARVISKIAIPIQEYSVHWPEASTRFHTVARYVENSPIVQDKLIKN